MSFRKMACSQRRTSSFTSCTFRSTARTYVRRLDFDRNLAQQQLQCVHPTSLPQGGKEIQALERTSRQMSSWYERYTELLFFSLKQQRFESSNLLRAASLASFVELPKARASHFVKVPLWLHQRLVLRLFPATRSTKHGSFLISAYIFSHL